MDFIMMESIVWNVQPKIVLLVLKMFVLHVKIINSKIYITINALNNVQKIFIKYLKSVINVPLNAVVVLMIIVLHALNCFTI